MPILVRTPCNADFLTISGNIGNTDFRSEPGDHESYLNGFISKPWGHEYRLYCDYLFDVWRLHIHRSKATSTHCHVRKDTVLICLSGYGTTSFLSGDPVGLSPGKFVYITRGVFHRTQASESDDLDLIEVENPRNKFDLLRIGDDYGRTAKGYEPAATSHEALEPMRSIGRSILYRSRDLFGTHHFSVSRFSHEHLDDADLRFAVMVDIQQHLAGQISVLQPDRPDFHDHLGALAFLIRKASAAPAAN